MRTTLRTIALIAGVALAALATGLAASAWLGMNDGNLAHAVLLLAPAAVATIAAAALARPLVARLPSALSFAAVGAAAALVSVVNFAVLSHLMVVQKGSTATLLLLLAYAVLVAVAASFSLARTSSRAVDRVATVAARVGEGDLSARVGELDGSAELRGLAVAIDAMSERLELAAERERVVDDQRRDLMVAVSHDLRTPLASLRAMTEAIEDRVVTEPDDLRRYAGEMHRSVMALSALVDDLFQLVQLDAASLAGEARSARLSDVVSGAADAVRGAALARGVAIEVRLGPAAASPCSPRLTRVVQNLLDNAVRHSHDGGRVVVAATADTGSLHLTVEDEGEGIDPGDSERIFEPFWRGDASRRGSGAGLGLSLARRIVEALGGGIAARSELGGGTTFAVTLPLG